MSAGQFANELGVLPATLLEQLRAAGVSKNLAEDILTETNKAQLLRYLRNISIFKEQKRSAKPPSHTLESKEPDSTGKRSNKVQVHKKRRDGKQSAGRVATRPASFRLEILLLAAPTEDGQCAACLRGAPEKWRTQITVWGLCVQNACVRQDTVTNSYLNRRVCCSKMREIRRANYLKKEGPSGDQDLSSEFCKVGRLVSERDHHDYESVHEATIEEERTLEPICDSRVNLPVHHSNLSARRKTKFTGKCRLQLIALHI